MQNAAVAAVNNLIVSGVGLAVRFNKYGLSGNPESSVNNIELSHLVGNNIETPHFAGLNKNNLDQIENGKDECQVGEIFGPND